MSTKSKTTFLDLPRELRDQVYREVLVHKGGIHLKVNRARAEYRFSHILEASDSTNEDTDSVDGSPETEQSSDSNIPLSPSERLAHRWQFFPTRPITSGLLLAHSQIHHEATETLYGANAFTFHSSALRALVFLSSLGPPAARHIKSLSFRADALDFCVPENKRFWAPLCAFVAEEMRVRDVTVTAPIEEQLDPVWGNHPFTRPRCAEKEEFARWYYWQAAERLVALLAAGKVRRVRLAFGEAYDADPEAFGIVRRLRCLHLAGFEVARGERRDADEGPPGATVLALTRGPGRRLET